MQNGALPHMLAVLGGVRLVSQLPGNQNIKMINALSESLCEVPDTVTFADIGMRERRQEQVFTPAASTGGDTAIE